MDLAALQRKWNVEGVRFVEGNGGLPLVQVRHAGNEADIYLHGAHVAHYRPAGAENVIWMSRKSWFEPRKPIRGGVPVCWPWFGPSEIPNAPGHGFARLCQWQVESVAAAGGEVVVTLLLRPDEYTRGICNQGEFELRHIVSVGSHLKMTLETTNRGSQPFAITEALHTYFAISDIRKVSLAGLEGAEYWDRVAQPVRVKQDQRPITFAAETDRSYTGTTAACTIIDAAMGRRIHIAKSGSNSTVVWNPWTAKAARMVDYDDNEWPGMLCVETANAHEDAVTMPPGTKHAMTAEISVTASR